MNTEHARLPVLSLLLLARLTAVTLRVIPPVYTHTPTHGRREGAGSGG
jgi:hypothetical protein